MGVDGLLRSKGDRFFGILNGLDTTVWDPAADGDIAAAYSSADLTGKAACRADLLERVGFDPDEPGMVFGMIGRLDPQKGFDLVAGAAPAMLERGGRIVVQGSGHPDLAEPFRRLAAAKPDRVALVERFDRVMARRIYAGADAFLMPSRFEPCGQGQMIALRYGTPPVVHRTGGLADTVVDVTRDAAAGTGFVFEKPTPAALAEACDRGDDDARRRRPSVGRPAGSWHGRRLRLGHGLRATLRRGVPARGRDPRRDGPLSGTSLAVGVSSRRAPGEARRSALLGASAAGSAGRPGSR